MGEIWTGDGGRAGSYGMVSVVLNRAVGSRGIRRGDQMGPQGSRRWDRWLLVVQGPEPRMSLA